MDLSSRTYDVFLSYNTRDHQAVERIGKWLEDHEMTCFMDRWYLVPGTPWPVSLEQALDRSKAVVIFLGPGEMGRWQQREQHLALDRQTLAKLPVVPVLLPAGALAQEQPQGSLESRQVIAPGVKAGGIDLLSKVAAFG